MELTERQMQIAFQIDRDVARIGQSAKTTQAAEEAIIKMMPKYMNDFKHLLDSQCINELCETYPGLHIYAQMMERIAVGCRDGLFDDIIR